MSVERIPWLGAGSEMGIVSVDWMAFSCVLGHPYDGDAFNVPDGWKVVPMSGTAVWSHRFFLMDGEGNKVATLLCTPKSPIIDARRAVVEIANPWLYSADYERVVQSSLDIFPMSVDGINRVDLCCDFEMDRRKWGLVRELEEGRAYLKGLRKGNVWWSSDTGRRIPHQLSWGGKDSTFKWKLYWKYKELHEGGMGCSKPYIENIWVEAGMVPKKVWRLEVSIVSSNGLIDVRTGERYPYFDWYRNRVGIYRSVYGDKFVVREFDGHANRRYDPVVQFLHIDGEKLLKHDKSSGSDVESDVERRVVCKMFKEYQDPEVRADDVLVSAIREFLMTMCQYPRNVYALCRRFGLTETEVVNAIWPCS